MCVHLFIGNYFFSSIVWPNICILIFFMCNINVDSMNKINDFKNDALKAQRVEKTFEIRILLK